MYILFILNKSIPKIFSLCLANASYYRFVKTMTNKMIFFNINIEMFPYMPSFDLILFIDIIYYLFFKNHDCRIVFEKEATIQGKLGYDTPGAIM